MIFDLRQLREKYTLHITGVIHIGGHYGQEISSYVENQITDIILFEPLVRNFKQLKIQVNKFPNANFHLHMCALGSEHSISPMYVSSNDAQSSSLLKPKQHLIQYPDITFSEQETVHVYPLDYFDYTSVNFINMDVQGYELQVLKGAKSTLSHIDYINAEVNREEVYENNVIVEELDEYLKDFSRVETDWVGDSWGDAFYIRTTKIEM